SAVKLKAEAIANVIKTYQNIQEHGEMYRNQLRLRMGSLIPLMFGPDASIRIKKLQIASPEGSLSASGKIAWPGKNHVLPSGFLELVQTSAATIHAEISKKLLLSLIEFSSNQPLMIRNAAAKDQKILLDARDRVDWAMRSNAVFVANLVDDQVLPEREG